MCTKTWIKETEYCEPEDYNETPQLTFVQWDTTDLEQLDVYVLEIYLGRWLVLEAVNSIDTFRRLGVCWNSRYSFTTQYVFQGEKQIITII